MTRIGVVTALPAEARVLSGRPQSPGTTQTPEPELLIRAGGMGPVAAAAAARTLIAEGARALVSWGCAAGLDPASRAGWLYLPPVVYDQAGHARFDIEADWHARLLRVLAAAGIECRVEALVSVTAAVTDERHGRELRRATGAALADMESAAVATAAAGHELPFLCVRAVADNPSLPLPAAILPALDDYGRPRTVDVLRLLLSRPALIPRLTQIGLAFARARGSLTGVARAAGRRLAHDTP